MRTQFCSRAADNERFSTLGVLALAAAVRLAMGGFGVCKVLVIRGAPLPATRFPKDFFTHTPRFLRVLDFDTER